MKKEKNKTIICNDIATKLERFEGSLLRIHRSCHHQAMTLISIFHDKFRNNRFGDIPCLFGQQSDVNARTGNGKSIFLSCWIDEIKRFNEIFILFLL